jgi:hypothetical protein
VPGCGNPYLEYHHFDPPWAEEQHHDPARMVALCAEHHAKAAAFTVEQCREMKLSSSTRRIDPVEGRFDWMRHDIVAVAGNIYYVDMAVIIAAGDTPLLWFNRYEQNHMLLNVRTPDEYGNERVSLIDNDWIIRGNAVDVLSPPNGAHLDIRYADGDRLSLRFKEWKDADALRPDHAPLLPDHYPPTMRETVPAPAFPLTVEVTLRLKCFGVDLTPRGSAFGSLTFAGGVIRSADGFGSVGIQLG